MSTNKPWVPDRRDMIWIDFNPQVGGEMKDEHPMLVLSTKAFNERTGIVIGLPMTHAQSNETNPFAVKFTTSKGEIGYDQRWAAYGLSPRSDFSGEECAYFVGLGSGAMRGQDQVG